MATPKAVMDSSRMARGVWMNISITVRTNGYPALPAASATQDECQGTESSRKITCLIVMPVGRCLGRRTQRSSSDRNRNEHNELLKLAEDEDEGGGRTATSILTKILRLDIVLGNFRPVD